MVYLGSLFLQWASVDGVFWNIWTFHLDCWVCQLKMFIHLYQLPGFEFGLYSSVLAPIWSWEDLKLLRYLESCFHTIAISETCGGEGLRSKPSVTMHAREVLSLADGTESHAQTLWVKNSGDYWPIALRGFCVWLCGTFFPHRHQSVLGQWFLACSPHPIDLRPSLCTSTSPSVFCAAQVPAASPAPALISIAASQGDGNQQELETPRFYGGFVLFLNL